MNEITNAERAAARKSGATDPEVFDKESLADQNAETINIEEMAAIYVSLAGKEDADPRALAVWQAAKDAGRIDAEGDYVSQEG